MRRFLNSQTTHGLEEHVILVAPNVFRDETKVAPLALDIEKFRVN
jgi:hypothetical protein